MLMLPAFNLIERVWPWQEWRCPSRDARVQLMPHLHVPGVPYASSDASDRQAEPCIMRSEERGVTGGQAMDAESSEEEAGVRCV